MNYKAEIEQLWTLKTVLDKDTRLPLRFDIRRLGDSLDLRRFQLTIKGVEGLIAEPETTSPYKAKVFTVTVESPPEYPYKMPTLKFLPPILFHPNVYSNGDFCWGTGNNAEPSYTLVDWFFSVVEYIQYEYRRIGKPPTPPANKTAMEWWKKNKSRIYEYIQRIDLKRLQHRIQQVK